MGDMTHFKSLLSRIMHRAMDSLQAQTCTLFLYDKNTRELWSFVLCQSEIAEIRTPINKGLAGNVFTSGIPCNVENAYNNPLFNNEIDKQTGFITREVLCVPIVSPDGRIHGVIQVINKLSGGMFTDGDMDKLQLLAKEAAKLIVLSERWVSVVPGLLFVASLVCIVSVLHSWLPEPLHQALSPLLVSIALGIACGNIFKLPLSIIPGIQFSLHNLLRLAIIAMGVGVTFNQAMAIGSQSFGMIVLLMLMIFILVHGLAKLLNMPVRLATLISAGTAICGNSAIAAIGPVINAKDEDMAFAIATNTLLGTVAVFVFPLIGTYAGLSDDFFGTWVGMAVNDTAQAVAAGFSFSNHSGEIATVVKMTRNTMIIAVVVLVGLVYSRWVKGVVGGAKIPLAARCKQAVPGFVVCFLLVACANSLGLFDFISQVIGRNLQADIKIMVDFLMLCSLTAVGLNTHFKKLRAIGLRSLCVGIAASLIAAVGAFALIRWLGAVVA